MAETSGVVQRLKWLPSTRIVLVEVGPLPTAVQLFLVTFNTTDPADLARKKAIARLIASAFGAGLPVSIFHDLNGSEITGVDVRFADIRVDGIEVTQTIQNLNQSVPLIALKSTVARVYLSSRLPAGLRIRGTLELRRVSGGATRTLLSLNSVTLDPARFGQVDGQRRDVSLSLNFSLPTDMTTGGALALRVTGITDDASNLPLMFGPPGDFAIVSFVDSPPLRLHLVGFTYPFGTPPQTRTPTSLDFGLTISWLQRAYPVASVVASQAIVPANATAPFGCGDINSQIAALRALDMAAGADARTHYYGIVSDSGFFMRGCSQVPSSPDPGAVGSGPTGSGTWGWDFDGSYGDWYAGHEIGHTFGRKHPGFCGETHDDPSYPFVGGQLANADDAYVGFDVGDAGFGLSMSALPGTDWHDVMTYCSKQWLSSYTYAGIRTRLVAEDALGPGGGGAGRPDERFPPGFEKPGASKKRTLVSVIAKVNPRSGVGRIAYVMPVARGLPTASDPGSPVTIRTRGTDGETLDEVRAPVKPFAEEGPEDAGHALCDPLIAVHPDAIVIELDINGSVVDTISPAATPPSIRDVRISAAQDETLLLSWDQQRQEEERIVYNVQMSKDNGRSWRTLAVGLQNRQVAIHPDNVPHGRRLLFRVQATDGFRVAETVVEWPGRESQ